LQMRVTRLTVVAAAVAEPVLARTKRSLEEVYHAWTFGLGARHA
jgi:hypothetical protein